MPVVSLICPHCETPVEIQITAVTRSRHCPDCGKTLMLQVAEKGTGALRKALLVAPKPAADSNSAREGDGVPLAASGNVFDRMCGDPSVQRLRRRLITGGSLVLGSIVLLTTLQLTGALQTLKNDERQPAASVTATQPAATASTRPQILPIVAPRIPDQVVPIGGAQFMALANLGEPRQVLQKFLDAATVEDRLPLIAERDKLAPVLLTYYKIHADGPIQFDRIEAHPRSGRGNYRFEVQLKGGASRTAELLETVSGYRVDWPSFVALGDLEWQEMMSKRPTEPVLMRILAAPDNRFVAPFADARQLKCMKLLAGADPSTPPVYGYVKRNSALAREIDYWLKQAESLPVALTLRLKYLPGATEGDQVWITEVVAPSWVVPQGQAVSQINR